MQEDQGSVTLDVSFQKLKKKKKKKKCVLFFYSIITLHTIEVPTYCPSIQLKLPWNFTLQSDRHLLSINTTKTAIKTSQITGIQSPFHSPHTGISWKWLKHTVWAFSKHFYFHSPSIFMSLGLQTGSTLKYRHIWKHGSIAKYWKPWWLITTAY